MEHVEEHRLYLVSRVCRCLCTSSCSHAGGCRWCSSIKALCCAQVLEYLPTDLKQFMDRTGRGPDSAPMPTMQIKVSTKNVQHVKHYQNMTIWCLKNHVCQ